MDKHTVNQVADAMSLKLKTKMAAATNDAERNFLQQQHNRQVDQLVFVLRDEIEDAGISVTAFRETAGRYPFLVMAHQVY